MPSPPLPETVPSASPQEAPTDGLRLPLPVPARGLALAIIATVVFLYALQWARDFLVPLALGILLSYTLNPVVCWLERWRVRRSFGATLITAAILCGSAATIEQVRGEFLNILGELPAVTHKLSRLLTGQGGALQRIQAAATEIEQATAGSGAVAPAAVGAKRPPRKTPPPAAVAAGGSSIKVIDWVWAGSRGLAAFLGQAAMVIFLLYFLLLSGDTFKRKLVRLTGPSLSKKKITLQILDDINTSIQAYMFMLLVTNVLLGLLMWLALSAIGLENAGAWAVVAGLLHLMPYFGTLLLAAATGAAALLQFGALQPALMAVGAALAIATLVGTVVTTWMTGRIARMNAAAVFVSLLFWGWLWGVWGLLLGVPLIVIVKVVAERVAGLEVLAELLGD
ncbi:AI-2E family transporter [Massilia sp. BJB1822]|uniref:AI-2E family transporter n=1 Tax=Massilia sp. BJB1822 TaxID=2744470 RepID=UPI0015945392|nr:AI-2E family transporter [Massilia sp. BJB1822]NVE01660.1 AI-2E family transporter [Massilia sp. BJB1822]